MIRLFCLVLIALGVGACTSSLADQMQAAGGGNDGEYRGVLAPRGYGNVIGAVFWPVTATLLGTDGHGTILNPVCGQTVFAFEVSTEGNIIGTAHVFENGCSDITIRVFGAVHGGRIELTMGLHNGNGGTFTTLTRKGTGAG